MAIHVTMDGTVCEKIVCQEFGQEGKILTRFSVRSSRGKKDRNDQWISDFMDVTSMNQSVAKAVEDGRLVKGAIVMVYGTLDIYTKEEGDPKRYSVLADKVAIYKPAPRDDNSQSDRQARPAQTSRPAPQRQARPAPPAEPEFEDPFAEN